MSSHNHTQDGDRNPSERNETENVRSFSSLKSEPSTGSIPASTRQDLLEIDGKAPFGASPEPGSSPPSYPLSQPLQASQSTLFQEGHSITHVSEQLASYNPFLGSAAHTSYPPDIGPGTGPEAPKRDFGTSNDDFNAVSGSDNPPSNAGVRPGDFTQPGAATSISAVPPPPLPLRDAALETQPTPVPSDIPVGEVETTAQEPTAGSVLATNAPTGSVPARLTDPLKETYGIKRITWLDGSGGNRKGTLRSSPILTQTINGPCPLLALVNTMILITPVGVETPLLAAFQSRENISLGLLLDAVFDQLTSEGDDDEERDGAVKLPDVTSLYSFLVTLHTGMNVNPIFTPFEHQQDGEPEDLDSARNKFISSLFHPTPELQLYSVFQIPLLHGWLPGQDTRTYRAFKRSAETYEDAQYLLLQEDSLLEKFCADSGPELTETERETLENGMLVKEFLIEHSTQLTPYGLEYLTKVLQPGKFYIFFRNDHFSTLYKEPTSGLLMSLVTDAGYASHEEVVWETLVDVSGQESRLLSGDFREVGNLPPSNRPARTGAGGSMLDPMIDPVGAEGSLSKEDQESRDLAFAIQLQEEEDSRAARRRTQTQAPGSRGWTAGGRSGTEGNTEVLPIIPPRRSRRSELWTSLTGSRATETGGASGNPIDGPPPTYDQVARATRLQQERAGGGLEHLSAPSTPGPTHPVGFVSPMTHTPSRRKEKEKCIVM